PNANRCLAASPTTAIVRSPSARPNWTAAVPTPPAAPWTSRVAPGWARRRGPDRAGGPVDQQGLAWLGAAPPGQGQQAGQVVEGQRRGGLQAQAVRQGQDALRWGADALLPAAVGGHDGDRLAGGQAQVGPGRPDGAGGVHARGEGQGHLELVGPGGLEQVGERHPGRDHADEHPAVGGRLLALGPLDRRWAGEVLDPVGEHRLLPWAPDPAAVSIPARVWS